MGSAEREHGGREQREHGGIDARELARLGLADGEVLDFSVNLNPYGPCATVRAAIERCDVSRYPDPEHGAARRAIAHACAVDASAVLLGNGATELLWTLVRVLAPSGASAVIAEPAFSEVRAACEALGVAVHGVRGDRAREYVPAPDVLVETVRRTGAAFVYLCNPSTPIGAATAAPVLAELAIRLRPAWLLLDESFLSLSDAHADAQVALPPNVVRVRSLTKDHAIAGIRLGYALAPAEIVRVASLARPSWNVSTPAQAAAVAAMASAAFVADSRDRIAHDRAALVRGLRALGLEPYASAAPYVAFDVRADADAAALRERLLVRRRVLVRACGSFGLSQVLRVAVRPEAERAQLLAALQAEL